MHSQLRILRADVFVRLGENPGFLLIFYQFLADRFKDSEYTGSLIAGILEVSTGPKSAFFLLILISS